MSSMIFGFALGLSPSFEERAHRKLHPECGGTKKVTID
jgi:hypothetical protein